MTAKKFSARVAGYVLVSVLWVTACAVLLLPACASLNGAVRDHSAAVSLVASVATLKYIESAPAGADQAARAHRVRLVAAELERVAADESVTIAELATLALQRVPVDLSPSDRLIAVALVQTLAQELEARLGTGGLNADSLVSVRTLLRAVDQAAAFYAPS